MYKEVNRIENTSGNILRHSDINSVLRYKFRDEHGEIVEMNKSDIKHIRLNNYVNKSYIDIQEFIIDGEDLEFKLTNNILPGTYFLEVMLKDGRYFPANDDERVILRNSSLSSEANKIEIHGFEEVVAEAVSRIDLDSYLVDTQQIIDDAVEQIGYDPVGLERDILDKVPINSKEFNVMHYGAVGDGITDDRNAIQELINNVPENSVIYFPAGTYLVDFVIFVKKNIVIKGDGRLFTKIKLQDNSKLFHNPNRDNTDRNKQTGENLFRDFHSIFFFADCDVNIHDLEIDGNPSGQHDIVNGVTWNYVGPSIGDKSRDYYKYYHLVQIQYNKNNKYKIDIQNCYFHGGTWNNVVINNNGTFRAELDKSKIFNNVFEGSAQDMLSLHFISDLEVKSNTFINPNSHCVHLYYETDKILVDNNTFIFNDEVNWIVPNQNDSNRILEGIRLGHGVYKSNIMNAFVTRNTIDVRTDALTVYAIVVSNTTTDVIIDSNVIKNASLGIYAQSVMLGNASIKSNNITHKLGGIITRPSLNNGTFIGVPDGVILPISATVDIDDNSVQRKGNQTSNADIVVNKPNYNEAELRKYVFKLRNNKYNSIITDKSIKFEINETVFDGTLQHEGVISPEYSSNRKSHDLLKIENNPVDGGQSDVFINVDVVDSRRGLLQYVVKVALSTNEVTVENIRGDETNSLYMFSLSSLYYGLKTLQVSVPAITPATVTYKAVSRTHKLYKR